MRKLLALLLCLALCLSASGALAVSVTTFGSDDASDNVSSLVAANGCFYALSGSGTVVDLLRYVPETRARETLAKVANSSGCVTAEQAEALLTDEATLALDKLFSDGTTLYGVSLVTGTIYALLDETGAFDPKPLDVKLDTSALFGKDNGEPYALEVAELFAQDGLLCYLAHDYVVGEQTLLGTISLTTGEARALTLKNVTSLCAYREGKALVALLDMANIMDETTGEIKKSCEFGTLDLASGTYAALGELPGEGDYGVLTFSGLRYASDKDCVYYSVGGKIKGYDLATGETRTSAYTGDGLIGGYGLASAYIPGYFAQGGAGTLVAYALDTDAVQRGALTIFGEYGTDAHKSFAKAYPDIPTETSGNYQSDLASLTTAMVSSNDAYDVLLLALNYMPVKRLIAKGYCAPLNDYPEIMSRLEGMDQRFLDAVTVDGKVYAVPVVPTATTYGVDMEQWEALGLTEDDLPKTLPELYEFLANWEYDYADEYPDVHPFDYGCDRTILFSMMLDNYVNYCQSSGEELTFDTEVWRGLLKGLNEIDFDNMLVEKDDGSFYAGPHLFILYASMTDLAHTYGESIRALPLAMADGLEPTVGVSTSVLILNPRSDRTEDALLYIANYLDHLADSDRIALYPADNEPVENPSYDKQKAELESEIAKKETALNAAEESVKAGLRDELETLRQSLEKLEDARYSITAESIARFREDSSPKLFVAQQSVLYSGDQETTAELNKLLIQYLEGAIDEEQMIKELDQRMWMMRMEDQ